MHVKYFLKIPDAISLPYCDHAQKISSAAVLSNAEAIEVTKLEHARGMHLALLELHYRPLPGECLRNLGPAMDTDNMRKAVLLD